MKFEGKVIESLPNTEFRVDIGSRVVRAYLSGKMRMHKIKVLINDTVELEGPANTSIYRITKRK